MIDYLKLQISDNLTSQPMQYMGENRTQYKPLVCTAGLEQKEHVHLVAGTVARYNSVYSIW